MPEFIEITKMLATGQIQFKKGEVLILSDKATFVPLNWIITLQRNLEKRKADNLIYYSAKEMGVQFFKGLYDHFKISAEDVIKWGINLLALGGWGETRTPEINFDEKYYKIILNGGAEGKAFGNVKKPVDHFVRGCYAGGAKVLFGGECDAVEVHCVADGSPLCEFIAQPTEKFNQKDPIVKEQLLIPEI